MQRFQEIENVLAAYPADCRPGIVETLGGAGGFSGAQLWRLTAPRETLCLRQFPPEHPDPTRLTWIQSVVAYVAKLGFRLLPLAIATRSGEGFCEYGGYLWELTPWMPGTADFWSDRRPEKLRAAMRELARFHVAAATFSSASLNDSAADLAVPVSARSPGIADRLALVDRLLAGGLDKIRAAVVQNRLAMPALADHVEALFRLVTPRLAALQSSLVEASRIESPLQPCLRDIWHDHVLFEGDRVSGIVDVGAMRIESVAADVARLLGSFCGNDHQAWRVGQAAFEAVRPLSADEQALVWAFDRSQLLLAGISWVEWVFVERRTFCDPSAVVKRMEHILSRLGVEFGVR
ncbi:MAG: phosphotransferase [Pirellulales bacterium]